MMNRKNERRNNTLLDKIVWNYGYFVIQMQIYEFYLETPKFPR